MPKRNRHREMLKTQGGPVSRPATQTVPTKAPASKPATAEAPAPKAKKPRLPTPPLSPEERKAKDLAKRKRREARLKEKIPAILEVLDLRWPQIFPKDPAQARPWAVGLFHQVAKQDVGFPNAALREALKRYARSEGYQAALARGGPRYDLQGSESGEVLPEQVSNAKAKLTELAAKKKKAAEGTDSPA